MHVPGLDVCNKPFLECLGASPKFKRSSLESVGVVFGMYESHFRKSHPIRGSVAMVRTSALEFVGVSFSKSHLLWRGKDIIF